MQFQVYLKPEYPNCKLRSIQSLKDCHGCTPCWRYLALHVCSCLSELSQQPEVATFAPCVWKHEPNKLYQPAATQFTCADCCEVLETWGIRDWDCHVFGHSIYNNLSGLNKHRTELITYVSHQTIEALHFNFT